MNNITADEYSLLEFISSRDKQEDNSRILLEQTKKILKSLVRKGFGKIEHYSNIGDWFIPDMDAISINLDDGIFTDRNAELDYWIKVVNAGFGTDVMAIEKVLNVTPEKALEIKGEISGNAVDDASSERSSDDVGVYGE